MVAQNSGFNSVGNVFCIYEISFWVVKTTKCMQSFSDDWEICLLNCYVIVAKQLFVRAKSFKVLIQFFFFKNINNNTLHRPPRRNGAARRCSDPVLHHNSWQIFFWNLTDFYSRVLRSNIYWRGGVEIRASVSFSSILLSSDIKRLLKLAFTAFLLDLRSYGETDSVETRVF